MMPFHHSPSQHIPPGESEIFQAASYLIQTSKASKPLSLENAFDLIDSSTRFMRTSNLPYHNPAHIEDALHYGNLAFHQLVKTFSLNPKEQIGAYRRLLWAILFHDSIYVPGNRSNEERSAFLAKKMMEHHGEERKEIEAVHGLILWTRHHRTREVDSIEKMALHDADFSVLGSPPKLYQDYCNHIEKEWIDNFVVSSSDFEKGRIRFLVQVLEDHSDPRFFYGLDSEFSARAFMNLKNELKVRLDRVKVLNCKS